MRARKSRAAASATGRVPARSPSVEQAGRDVVEAARRDADDADAELLQPLGDAGRRTGLPDDGDGRRERDDALVVEPEGVADLRQRLCGLGIVAVSAHRHDLVGGAGGEQHLGQVRRDAHDALARGAAASCAQAASSSARRGVRSASGEHLAPECRATRAHGLLEPPPVEGRPRVGLAPGRDVAVPGDPPFRERRIGALQRREQIARAPRTGARRTASRPCPRARRRSRNRCSRRGRASARSPACQARTLKGTYCVRLPSRAISTCDDTRRCWIVAKVGIRIRAAARS